MFELVKHFEILRNENNKKCSRRMVFVVVPILEITLFVKYCVIILFYVERVETISEKKFKVNYEHNKNVTYCGYCIFSYI